MSLEVLSKSECMLFEEAAATATDAALARKLFPYPRDKIDLPRFAASNRVQAQRAPAVSRMKGLLRQGGRVNTQRCTGRYAAHVRPPHGAARNVHILVSLIKHMLRCDAG